MATHIWTGNAGAVAQVDRFTPANVGIGDIFTLTCNTKTISFTATAATVANVTAGLNALWNASAFPEMAELTAADGTTFLSLTSDTAGVPFTVTSTTTDGNASNTQTLVRSAFTANAGPNVFAAANFDSATLPSAGDDVIIDGAVSNQSILYGLDQSAIGTLASLKITNSYSGKIGLPEYVTSGSLTYPQYRGTSLILAATSLTVDANSGRIKLDTGSAQTALRVKATGASESTQIPTLQWVGTHASNTVSIDGGIVGLAFKAASVATIATLRLSGGDVKVGSGVTLTTVVKSGGTLYVACAATTITQNGGDLRLTGTGTITTLNNNQNCTVYHESSATITAYVGNGTSILNCDASAVTRTITNLTLNDSAQFQDTCLTVTHTNPPVLYGDIAGRFRAGRVFTIAPS